ncbi:MAG: pyrroloquinoline-quinone synthase [Solirubrobacteraceae bacterium]|nr:pyrroloquinoline-quinone synthase [Solirubrobacteraceae bacterium]
MEDFWSRLEEVRSRWNVLEHPFYERWSEGALSREDLGRYAGQYRHVVVALADAAASAARHAEPAQRRALEAHAAEEASHVALWDDFARAVDGDPASSAEPETTACAEAWAGDGERELLPSLVALYAIESGQPAISETKLAGLREHYAVDDPSATAYFELHAELDHAHAAAERALIEPRLAEADAGALLAEAESVLRANWRLLDGVQRINERNCA